MSTPKGHHTTIEGVVSYSRHWDEDFFCLVLKDMMGEEFALHLNKEAVQQLAQRFRAGPVPYDEDTDPFPRKRVSNV